MSGWPPKDWRALLALVFSILGAVVLTLFVWWGVAQLLPDSDGWRAANEPQRLYTIRWVLWIATGAIATVLIGLGMAINRRSFKGNIGKAGFDFEGGDEQFQEGAAKGAKLAADAAQDEATALADGLPSPNFGDPK